MHVKLCFLIFLAILKFGAPKCFRQRGHSCCNGFIWDSKDETCKPCPIGFYGSTCTLRCRYPNFGEQCQGVCTCVKSLCSPIHGCDSNDISAEYILTSSEMNRIPLNIVTNAGKVNIDHVPNIYGISLIAILGTAVIILPVVFLIYKITKLRTHMMQIVRRNRNDENIATYKTTDSHKLGSIHDIAERSGAESTVHYSHAYEDISSRQSRSESKSSTASTVSCKADDDYLSPV